MNPLGNNKTNNVIDPKVIGDIKTAMQIAANPEAAFMSMANKNPQFNVVLDMCRGKDPEQVFKSMCAQRGVDPNDILNQLR